MATAVVPRVRAKAETHAPVVPFRSARRRWSTQAKVVLVLTLALTIVIVTHGISKGEFNYNVDESQHAASGLFFASLLRDLPIAHPVRYTYAYYAQYPALSGVVHWPPVFYVAEGAAFYAFGASVVTARITILFFSVMACAFWFCFVKKVQHEWAAAVSATVFCLLPSILLSEKTVMLEMPCLAFSIAALYFWYTYLTTERRASLYWFAALAGLSLLVKQNAIFLAVVCPLSALLLGKWKLVLSQRILGPLAIVSVLVVPFYTEMYLLHGHTVSMDAMKHGTAGGSVMAHHVRGLLFYLQTLPKQLGWLLLVLAALGIVTWRWWGQRTAAIFMMSWIAGCYLTFTAIPNKGPRHALYWLAPLTYFIAGPLTAKWRVLWLRLSTAVLCLSLVVNSAVVGWEYQRPYLSGYGAVAQQIVKASGSGIILFDARLPANFIFFLRTLDTGRHFLVLRKALWTARIIPDFGVEEFVKTREEVSETVVQDGVKYIVISDQPCRFQAQSRLRDLLEHDSRFQLLNVFPIESNEPDWKGKHLYLYRNKSPSPPTSEFLHIRMMTLSHDIVLPWSQFRQVW